MRQRRNKGQEEIVGFVLVVLIVAIISVILLGIAVRRGGSGGTEQSVEVSQFLDALFEYTSNCTTNGYSYKKVDELIEDCESGGVVCSSGESACEVLGGTIIGVMNKVWVFGEDAPRKGYEMRAEVNDEILKGFPIGLNNPCEGSFIGADKSIFDSEGSISVTLEICTS